MPFFADSTKLISPVFVETIMATEVRWANINETYQINTLGQVRRIGQENCLKPQKMAKGYTGVRVGIDGKKYIHHLMARAFLGPAPTLTHVIDHIDRNRRNNILPNLRWVSMSENQFNRPIVTTARTTSKTGHHHIILRNGIYEVRIKKFGRLYHRSKHGKNLKQAIEMRDTIIRTLNTHNDLLVAGGIRQS